LHECNVISVVITNSQPENHFSESCVEHVTLIAKPGEAARTDAVDCPGDRSFLRQLYIWISVVVGFALFAQPGSAQCSSPANAIVAENCLPGNPASEWDVSRSGDPSIQGFSTDISVNAGQTVFFKISTPARAYQIEIYRMGYYAGMGARRVTTIAPSAKLPQTQPACLTDAATQLYDCGNWSVSASWNVPSTAVSGLYFARLIRSDTGGDSHIFFVVRNDAGHSDLLFQTSDETWQAYNNYGGHSLYGTDEFDLPNRGFRVSYNRPSNTRSFEAATFLFTAEYPMIRWLEANGYDVNYFTGVDAARNGNLIKNHKVFLSVGHDEYVSGQKRNNIEAALAAGVNLAFFSGNEFFWKTRWENSIDGSNTPYRTMVCYKETLAGSKLDPADPPTWTGTWRDSKFSPPADGGRPENALTGTLFMVNGPGSDNTGLAIKVPAGDGQMRFWRDTTIARLAAGQSATLPSGTLGYEWDADIDNGFRPAGLVSLSTSTYPLTNDLLLDSGATYGAGSATHHLSFYRAPSGALVFGAGTVQWSWGLDDNHDASTSAAPSPDVRMQQATLNLFADMGVQPASIQPGLIRETRSTDTALPVSRVVSPASGTTVTGGTAVTITGTATDSGGGVVGAVEVSTDGGHTWHPAVGRGNWTYTWNPAALGAATVLSRAVDDSGNLELPSAGASYTVAAHDCPCSFWPSSPTPSQPDSGDGSAIEVGISFEADYDGYITGLRFYKNSSNTGTHVGHVWSSSGQLLGTAVFKGETASGWQQVSFSSPVAVAANTTYVASYFAPNGHYAANSGYFSSTFDNLPLHASRAANGVYSYGSSSSFPTASFNASNYWVDIIYMPAASMPGAPPSLVASSTNLSFAASVGQGPQTPPQTVNLLNQGSGALSWTASASAPWIVLSAKSGSTPASLSVSINSANLSSGVYNGTITITPSGGGTPQVISVSLSVTNILLSTSFASSGMEGWAVSPLNLASNWSVVNQALQYNGGGHTQLFAGSSAWSDYTVEVGVKLTSISDYPGGFRGRVDASSGASYAVWLYPAEGLIRLYRTVGWNINSGYTQIGQASALFDTQSFHRLALSFQGSTLQVSYDGDALITATDSTYAGGMVALDVSNQVISYDHVLVTSSNAYPNALVASPSPLSFTVNYQSTNPSSQSLQLAAANGGTLTWTAVSTASWLNASTYSGVAPASLQVSVNPAQLAPGTYNGSLRMTALAQSATPQLIPVSVNVIASPPALQLNTPSLNFVALVNQANPSAQTLAVSNAGYGPLTWTASTDAPWLSIDASAGSAPSSIAVSVTASGLPLGNYTGHVLVTSPGVSNSPQSVTVNLSVLGQDLNENFTNPGAGWVVSPMGHADGWKVNNGVYSYSGSGLSQSCTGNSGWSDYTFDTSVRLSTLNNWPGGVRARVNASTGAGYAVWLYPASGMAILYRVSQWDINGSGLTLLAQASLSFDATDFHGLQIAFAGSQISVYWDSKLLMRANDSTYSSGFICMDADSQPISYQNVRVASSQPPVTLSATPSGITFSAMPGGTLAPQTVTISAAGASTAWGIQTSGAWLSAAVSSTMTPAAITLSANPAGLPEGTYSGTVTVFAPGGTNSPITIPVTLAVKTAVMGVTPSSLTFFGAVGAPQSAQAIAITNGGTGNLAWQATTDSNWIGLSSTSGSAPGSISVSPKVAGIGVGQYTGNITIASQDVGTGPVTVPVSLQLGTALFSDDFSSGTASNWTISPLGNASGWSVANGLYTYNGQGATESWAGSMSWTDYTVSVDFRLASPINYPGGLRGRLNTSTGASYGVWIYPSQGVLKLFRIDQWYIDAGNSLLAQSQVLNMDTTHTHNLRLSFKGSQISVYYDNALAMQATDPTYIQGGVALDVSNQPIGFTNVSVIGF
jgi:hypothetical protein